MNKYVEPPARRGARATEPLARRATALASKGGDRYKDAQRHSRRVRFFRWALPVGVVTMLGLTVAVNYLDPFSIAVDLPFELGRVSLSGTQVKMEFPRLHGFTADNRSYNVSAISASQDLTKPDSINLDKIDAKMELANNGWANLTANAGHYNTKTEQLELTEGVRFDTSSGYGGTLKDAAIDIKGGKLVSNHPVELTYQDGKLTADSIEVTQKDSRALLTGNVQLDFKMPPADGDTRKSTEAPKLRGATTVGVTP
ncbi:LPS export ABC transporter periplasmic protein LptC [Ancylobacter moscoviensis]|uniref:LPS export ABC transporter periplasmic protein LptC n=1 Tax=Ancylobacter moscoviensis TaxID=2597768 RepID=UPI001FEE469F|nr:LPS export ABC transporter periplasmic protein LptC [Ancylobacter moscoviensis]